MPGEGIAPEARERVSGERADDRQVPGGVQGQRPAAVGEQHDRLFRQAPGQAPVGRRVEVQRGRLASAACLRRIEQAQIEFLPQDPAGRLVDEVLGHVT